MNRENDQIVYVSRIQQHYNTLSSAERRVADYIIENSGEIADMPVAQIAELANVSQATVVRFCQTLGFKGIAEFKLYLSSERLDPFADYGNVEKDDSMAIVAQKICRFNQSAIEDCMNTLDAPQLEKAVDALNAARCVYIFAAGGSLCTARCAYDILAQIDLRCELIEDPVFQLLAASRMKPGDVALTVCHSGRSRTIVDAAEMAHKQGATVISIIGIRGTTLCRSTDVPLFTGLSGHTHFSETVAARICELNVVSALHAALVIRNQEHLGDYRFRVSNVLESNRYKR